MNLTAMPIIQDKDHYYVFISDEEKPVNGWYYDEYISKIRHTGGAEYGYAEHCKQIIYQSKPIHEGMPVVDSLSWEIDVDRLAKETGISNEMFTEDGIYTDGFKDGYYKHAENFMFTKDDMLGLLEVCKKSMVIGTSAFVETNAIKYIQSLKKPKVYQVEIEEKVTCYVPATSKPIIKSWKEIR